MLIVIIVLLALCQTTPFCWSDGYTQTYQLLDSTNSSIRYRLNVAIPQALYEYYIGKSHKLTSSEDFPKFVTSYALKPIADCLRQIYTDDEDFANGALMVVHQIPYEETEPAKYPVETMVKNTGDCDLFSYIAASIMKAGGLDVVLLYYENEAHMNVGVHISQTPEDTREHAYSITYNDVQYYVAECTGGNWEKGWRVGECPLELKNAYVQAISLQNSEQSALEQVSASYKTLQSSAISLSVSPTFAIQGSAITFSGQLSPTMQNKTVLIYVKVNNAPWAVLGTVTTDSNGRFAYAWNTENAGIYYVRASWSGDDTYAVADSSIQNITVLSIFFILLITLTIILACVGVVIFVVIRKTNQLSLEPQPPQIP